MPEEVILGSLCPESLFVISPKGDVAARIDGGVVRLALDTVLIDRNELKSIREQLAEIEKANEAWARLVRDYAEELGKLTKLADKLDKVPELVRNIDTTFDCSCAINCQCERMLCGIAAIIEEYLKEAPNLVVSKSTSLEKKEEGKEAE